MIDTHALSVAIHDKVRSEARVASGQAALWHSLGVAALLALGGLGVGAGLYGYAALVDTTSEGEAEKVASVLADALAKAEFRAKATGEVTVGGEVALRPGGHGRARPERPAARRPEQHGPGGRLGAAPDRRTVG